MTVFPAPSETVRERAEHSDAMYASIVLALSLGAIWDLATGHVAVFDGLLEGYLDDAGPSRTRSP